MIPLWKAPPEEQGPEGNAESETVSFSRHVRFSFEARLPRATLHSKQRRARGAKRLFDNPSASDPRRQLELKETVYEWVEYRAPLVCTEEDEDGGVCLTEEPAPCSDDPKSLVCSIDTRQLPVKRKRHPWVSVCIDDMGVDYYMSKRAVRLRPSVTLAYLPYGPLVAGLPGVREQARDAAAAGHELMVHLPMEPFNTAADAGPNALHSSMTPQQLKEHLHWALAQFEGYVGLNNHMGSLFTSKFHSGMTLVLQELKKRDLFFLDSLTATDSLGQELAAQLGTTFGARDVFLDSQPETSVETVDARLMEVEKLALKNGHAIAIGHPYPATLEALEKWLPLLSKKGLLLMPLSKALLRERKERERAAGEAVLAATRAEQLRAVQARRERVLRERQARALAAELEAEFGDGTVLGWRSLLDAGAEQALRNVLAKRQHPNGLLQAGLKRLFGVMRGDEQKHWGGATLAARVFEEGERALRRRQKPRQAPDVVAVHSRGEKAQLIRRGTLKTGQLPSRGPARREPWEGEIGTAVTKVLRFKEPSVDTLGKEVAAEEGGVVATGQGQPLLVSKRPQKEGGVREEVEQGRNKTDMGRVEDSQEVGELRLGVLLTVVLQQRGAKQAEKKSNVRTSCSWQDGARLTDRIGKTQGLYREDSKRATQQWLWDSPRTVIPTEQHEGEAESASLEYSPSGSGSIYLSSDGGFDGVLAREASSPNSSVGSPSSLSDASAEEQPGRGEDVEGEAALELATRVAVGLTLALHLTAVWRQKANRLKQGVPPGHARETAAADPVAEASRAQHGLHPSDLGAVEVEETVAKEAAVSSPNVLDMVAPGTALPDSPQAALNAVVCEAVPSEPALPRSSLLRPLYNALAALEARNSRKWGAPGDWSPPWALTALVPLAFSKPEAASAPEVVPQPQAVGRSTQDGGVRPLAAQAVKVGGEEQQMEVQAAAESRGPQRSALRAQIEESRAAEISSSVAPVQQGPALFVEALPESFVTIPELPEVERSVVTSAAPMPIARAQVVEVGALEHASSVGSEGEWCDAEARSLSPASSPVLSRTASFLMLEAPPTSESGAAEQSRISWISSTRTDDSFAKTVEMLSWPVGGGLQRAPYVKPQQEASGASLPHGWRPDLSPAGKEAPERTDQKGDQSADKKYSWWRWTVGCVLGAGEEAEQDGSRPVGSWAARGNRRVVPLDEG